ncbi:type II toxin-antitoxin system VapB family antitoxin [Brevundimonas sp.]|uniref:type II toxin-antitoxin system VapB family antitoxin n=1 Tax=Brevundimonas sp. TaxID=1871086 RepID=UPI0027317AEE|nr:type II toxin-antitoxin system VapB family antitoxin [Brevundimonas sp.]MDP1913542.1 type II toxin-antitoxin system VapB family antitoxin [Brevundimonas sp.]
MRTTITIDDELLRDAAEFSGLTEKSAIINRALKMMVEWEASRRLAAMGGTMPDIELPRRRRPSDWEQND